VGKLCIVEVVLRVERLDGQWSLVYPLRYPYCKQELARV
jgi:hypothetical protein